MKTFTVILYNDLNLVEYMIKYSLNDNTCTYEISHLPNGCREKGALPIDSQDPKKVLINILNATEV